MEKFGMNQRSNAEEARIVLAEATVKMFAEFEPRLPNLSPKARRLLVRVFDDFKHKGLKTIDLRQMEVDPATGERVDPADEEVAMSFVKRRLVEDLAAATSSQIDFNEISMICWDELFEQIPDIKRKALEESINRRLGKTGSPEI